MRRNWMPLYIPDFLADTAHLSAAETGAYLCLIMDYWLHGGLPDNDAKLRNIARTNAHNWKRMKPTICKFFQEGWRHKRVDAELTKMIAISTSRQQAASKAGTISSIKRANLASTSRAPDVNVTSTSSARGVHHTTQVSKITTTTSVAAPDAALQEIPEQSTPEPADVPVGSPGKRANLAASPELQAILARKYR